MAQHDQNPWAVEAEENASRGRSNVIGMKFTKREDGEPNYVRILPAKAKWKDNKPFFKYVVHWVAMKNSTKNKPLFHAVGDKNCPLCKRVSSLWSKIHRLKEEGHSDKSPGVKKLIADITAIKGKITYDMNVIDRDDPVSQDGKVKIKRLVAGPTIWKAIMELGQSKKWGNPSDAGPKGYNIGVLISGEGRNREYNITPDPDRNELTSEELEALETRGYDLADERPFSTEDDVKEILSGMKTSVHDNSDDDDSDDEGEPVTNSKIQQKTSSVSSTSKVAPKSTTKVDEQDDEDGEEDLPSAPKENPNPFSAEANGSDDDEDSSPEDDKESEPVQKPGKRKLPF